MTETATVTQTGLPDLPEGYFWRVGDTDINPGWYDNKPVMRPAVFIMAEATMETKTRQAPVYGENWWDKGKVVGFVPETYEVQGEPEEVFVQTFSSITTHDKNDIPKIGRITGTSSRNDVEYEWDYSVPVGRQGVAYLAALLKQRFDAWQDSLARAEAYKKAEAENKEELYGDYPPKSFGPVEVEPVPEGHSLMSEAMKLVEKFESYAEGRNDASMPPYSRGVTSTYHNAARALRKVLRTAK